MDRRNDRNRAIKFWNIRRLSCLCLTVAFLLISLSPSPMKPDVSDFHWSFIGFFLGCISAFIYLINDSVGPDFGDDDENS